MLSRPIYGCHVLCRLIYGFISKDAAKHKLCDSPCGTFLLRFSESNIEQSQRSDISGFLTLAVMELDPKTGSVIFTSNYDCCLVYHVIYFTSLWVSSLLPVVRYNLLLSTQRRCSLYQVRRSYSTSKSICHQRTFKRKAYLQYLMPWKWPTIHILELRSDYCATSGLTVIVRLKKYSHRISRNEVQCCFALHNSLIKWLNCAISVAFLMSYLTRINLNMFTFRIMLLNN